MGLSSLVRPGGNNHRSLRVVGHKGAPHRVVNSRGHVTSHKLLSVEREVGGMCSHSFRPVLTCLTLILAVTLGQAAAQGQPISVAEFGHAGPFTPLSRVLTCMQGNSQTGWFNCLESPPDASLSAERRIAAHHQRAVTYVTFLRLDEARRETTKALEIDPGSATAEHFAARLALTVFEKQRDRAQLAVAAGHLARASQLAPSDHDIMSSAAYHAMMRNALPDAVALSTKVLRSAPDDIYALTLRLQLNRLLGRSGDAFRDADRLVQLQPTKAAWRAARGNMHLREGRALPSIDDYSMALKLGGPDITNYLRRAEAYAAAGKLDLHIADLSAIIDGPMPGTRFALPPQEIAEYLLKRGLANIEIGRLDAAAEDIVGSVEQGERQNILRIQLMLRQRGRKIELDGAVSDAMKQAIKSCLVEDRCRQAILQGA